MLRINELVWGYRPVNETGQNWRDIYWTSRDGLRLYARHYPAPGSRRRPLVCLPGLTRNSRDFHALATALSDPRGHRREVYALDYRGRGLSEFDSDWKNYSVMVELNDTIDFMSLAGLAHAGIVGTSRGGVIAMAMAAMRPTLIGAVVLNDIGPVIERDGLARILAHVGRIPLPSTWRDAAELSASLNDKIFPAVSDAQWMQIARQWYNEKNDRPARGYDPNLAKALSLSSDAVSHMWPQFEALARVPVMVVRGALSDLFSTDTLDAMRRRHPNITTLTVENQGHAPLLMDDASIATIGEFLFHTDPATVGVHTNLYAVA